MHSYAYSCVYYSHVVADFLIYFVILLKRHFCLSSLASMLQDGNEQSSSLATIRITCRALKNANVQLQQVSLNWLQVVVGRKELDTALSNSSWVILMYIQG